MRLCRWYSTLTADWLFLKKSDKPHKKSSETKKDFESPFCFRRLYCLLYTSPGGYSPPGHAWRVAIQMSTAVNMV